MRVKILVGSNLGELEDNVNNFIASLSEEPKDVKVDVSDWSAVVVYDEAKSGICCECKWWDCTDEGLIGLCQRHGGRKRFSNKSCKEYVDIRRGE